MRICINCDNECNPTGRHKLCTKCRYEATKRPCPICSKMMQNYSKVCITCSNSPQICPTCNGGKRSKWPTCSKCIEPATSPNELILTGTRKENARGYIVLSIYNHPSRASRNGQIFEHRYIMEQHLGRFLQEGENVHHINCVKNDNRIDNLELWVSNQPAGSRAKDLLQWARSIVDRYEPIESLLT